MTTKESQGQGQGGWAVTHLEPGSEMLCWLGGGGGEGGGGHNRGDYDVNATTGVAKCTTACRITGQNIHEIPQWNVSRPPRKIPLAV